MLPGLATLIDPDAFAVALRLSCPGADITDVKLTKIRYSQAKSCRAEYEVVARGEKLRLCAKAHRRDALDKLALAPASRETRNPLGRNRVLFEELATVVTIFPHDDTLAAPRHFADPGTRRDRLRALLPERPDLWESKVRTLHYVSDKRYVVQLWTDAGSKAVLKFYTPSDFDHVAQVAARQPASTGSLQLARQIGCSRRHNMLAFEWLEGLSIGEAVSASELESEGGALIGKALAELHGLDPRGLISRADRPTPTRLRSYAQSIGFLCPDLAARVDRLAGLIASRFDDQPTVRCLIHGNFHANHVLLTDQAVAILDMDTLGIGEPAVDLGGVLGALELMKLKSRAPAKRLDQLQYTIVNRYKRAGGRASAETITLCTAIELLRSCKRPFRRRKPDWPARIQVIVEQTEKLVEAMPSKATVAPTAARGRF
jgi:hypothetical protein